MNIKNYTSSVPAEQSVSWIEKILACHGAQNITKRYDSKGRVASILFQLNRPDDPQNLVPILLEPRAEEIFNWLFARVRRPRPSTEETLRAQADRTAWKILSDWIEIQMSLVELKQVEFLQVFLGYVWDGKQTFYTHLKDRGFKQLEYKGS